MNGVLRYRGYNVEPIIVQFLEESNFIENVRDSVSIQDAIDAWRYLIKKDKLSTRRLLKTHAILMKNQTLSLQDIGTFRKCPVFIGGRQAKPWYAVPELMEEWVGHANAVTIIANTSPSTVEDYIITCHVGFESIHPFVDGNGRIGRILLNWQRVKAGLPIKIIKEDDKLEYYKLFSAL